MVIKYGIKNMSHSHFVLAAWVSFIYILMLGSVCPFPFFKAARNLTGNVLSV